jgi:hypothetical protein
MYPCFIQLHHGINGKVNLSSNHLPEALSLEKCSADHAWFQVLVPCSGWNSRHLHLLVASYVVREVESMDDPL